MPTTRARTARKGTARITPAAVEAYKKRDFEKLQDELGLGPGDRSPLDPENNCWGLLACPWTPESIRAAESIRDRIEAIIRGTECPQADQSE